MMRLKTAAMAMGIVAMLAGLIGGCAHGTAGERRFPAASISDSKALPDLWLKDAPPPRGAVVNSTTTFHVLIKNSLQAGLKTELMLFEGAEHEPVATKALVLPFGESTAEIDVRPEQGGNIKYTLKLPVSTRESNASNNSLSCRVFVAKRRINVLLIAGEQTKESQSLAQSLAGNNDVAVSCLYQSEEAIADQAGQINYIRELPRTAKPWQQYDVIIVFDIDPGRVTPEQASGIDNLVESSGGGILFVGGKIHGLAPLSSREAMKFRDLLPVEFDRKRLPDAKDVLTEPFRLKRTSAGKAFPCMMLSPNLARNNEIWESFATQDFFWACPTTAPKREATTLLVKQLQEENKLSNDCFLAHVRKGKGTSMFVGFTLSPQWQHYDQFWAAIIRSLSEYRLLGVSRQVSFTTDKGTCLAGETVQAQLLIHNYMIGMVLRAAQLYATVTDPRNQERLVMLEPRRDTSSSLSGQLTVNEPGEYTMRVTYTYPPDGPKAKVLFDETIYFNVTVGSP